MKVLLTVDVEIWCKGWENLDDSFPRSFERYVFGRSAKGDFALPKTLDILNRHALNAVFFVEPLFAARFGAEYLERIVRMIRDAGQEIQLHLHPEWTDEIRPPIIDDCAVKRQHLSYYSAEEQSSLIAHGRALLESVGSGRLSAFRAGSFAANRDTFEALRSNGIFFDSSLNRCHAVSAPELRREFEFTTSFQINGVSTFPVSTFLDGFGRDRPAQVGACSFSELREALWSAQALGRKNFVIVSHNFEMLKPGASTPDPIVVRRFEKLCAHLAEHRETFPTCGFASCAIEAEPDLSSIPHVSLGATAVRHCEQIYRRLIDRMSPQ